MGQVKEGLGACSRGGESGTVITVSSNHYNEYVKCSPFSFLLFKARKAKEEEAAAAAAAKSSSSLSSKFVFRSLVNRPTTPTG